MGSAGRTPSKPNQFFGWGTRNYIRRHSFSLLPVEADQCGPTLLGQGHIHRIAPSNLVFGGEFSSQLAQLFIYGNPLKVRHPA